MSDTKYLFTSNIEGERLGSQMNSFAMLYVLSQMYGYKVGIFSDKLHTTPYGQHLIVDGFNAPIDIINKSERSANEYENISLNSTLVNKKLVLDINTNKNYTFVGLFHSTFLYYLDYLKDIQNNFFIFKQEYVDEGNSWLLENKSLTKQHISVHIRRTDFLTCAAGYCSDEYYIRALSHFSPDKYKIFVFSDDIEYCKLKKDVLFSGFDVCFLESSNCYLDMYLMTQCDVNIIANSCFSTWGALLNKNNNIMVCPESMLPSCINFSELLAPYKSHFFVENAFIYR